MLDEVLKETHALLAGMVRGTPKILYVLEANAGSRRRRLPSVH